MDIESKLLPPLWFVPLLVTVNLVYEVLMYLNMYYYPMFAITNIGMVGAKYNSEICYTPSIGQDAIIQFGLVFSELIKLLLFNKFKHQRAELSIFVGILFSIISVIAILYVLIIQCPVLKMEYSLDSIMLVLLFGELAYGFMSIFPCFTKQETEK